MVITPLTALMFDQKIRFSSMGISVEFVGSAQEDVTVITAVLNGTVQLVFISPENVLNNMQFRAMFQKEVYQERMIALMVDEAHCVKLFKADDVIGGVVTVAAAAVAVLLVADSLMVVVVGIPQLTFSDLTGVSGDSLTARLCSLGAGELVTASLDDDCSTSSGS